MTEREFKSKIRGWTNVNLTGANPVGNFESCEWALEEGVPLDGETLAIAEYQRRLIGHHASKSPLTVQRLSQWRKDWTQTVLQFKDDSVCINATRPLDLVAYCEIALEAQVPLDSDTKERLAEAFPSSAIYRVQAFPLVAKLLGAIGGPQYDPDAITWYDDGASKARLPDEVQKLLPAGVIVAIQKCSIQINRQAETGFFKIQERWGNGVLQKEYGTKVPLSTWMHRGIPHCITVTLEKPDRDLAYLIGVFDIAEGSMAWISDDLMATTALDYVQGKNAGFLRITSNLLRKSTTERETIQAIMDHLQRTVFIPERNKMSKSYNSPRL